LTAGEVQERRALYGTNNILTEQRAGWGDVVRDTARDPMIWFLAATATLFFALGEYTDGVILSLALLPIAGMDAYLHRRTQATTEGLSGQLVSNARVLRQGAIQNVFSLDIVPGDLAIVSAGESFPADGLIVAGTNLQVDESTLTGEAMPVRKQPFAIPRSMGADAAVAGESWGAAGTRLLTGEARLRVVATGGETLYGQIVRLAREGQHARTPLQSAIGALVAVLVVISVVVCLALAVTRYHQGFGVFDAFISAVTLAVAALPEEFPIAFTVFLGVGVYRMARRRALVRRAVVVENIGRVTCICSDKTGTITEGHLRLVHLLPAESVPLDDLRRFAAMASRAESGDPMDLAILEAMHSQVGERLATYPFTENRRREAAVVRQDGSLLVVTKGAPETILDMSHLSAQECAAWLVRTEKLAASGSKVIAVASKPLAEWSGGEPDRDYIFAGLVGFEDPIREGVKEAIAQARAADIRVIMVTGDHVATAQAIARQSGIGSDNPVVVEGSALAGELSKTGGDGLLHVDVVARAMPAQKLDLVRALKASGEIVAVTGDGVNDVPALQGADIGIAMGERGTRSAREVASIVLLDDNFRTIIRAVAEGRQLFRNLKLSFAYLMMIHMPLVVTAAFIPFAGLPLLYLPTHIVWLELIIHPVALLVFQELPTSGQLEKVQRGSKIRFFEKAEWSLIAATGALVTILVTIGYAWSLGDNQDIEHARTMALMVLIVSSATITAGLSRLKSRNAVIAVAATVVSAVILSQVPATATLLHLSPLHWDDWLIVGASSAAAGALATLIPSVGRNRWIYWNLQMQDESRS
jgi:Ca2+-transporting ATPase